jgi:hypothetical protein
VEGRNYEGKGVRKERRKDRNKVCWVMCGEGCMDRVHICFYSMYLSPLPSHISAGIKALIRRQCTCDALVH